MRWLPATTGPFQDRPKQVDPIAAVRDGPAPQAGGTVAVLAFPAPADPAITARRAGQLVDLAAGDQGLELPIPGNKAPVVIDYQLDAPTELRSATLAFDSGATLFTAPRFRARLEVASVDGQFRKVADFPAGVTPQYSVAFPAVRAHAARIVIEQQPPAGLSFKPVPGAIAVSVGSLGAKPMDRLRIDEIVLSGRDQVHRWEEKAGFEAAFDYFALDSHNNAVRGVDPAKVINLTSHLRPDGTLDWTPPPGRWQVLRLGWSLTGKENHPATVEGTGLEVDKYDAAAVQRYIDQYLASYDKAVGQERIGKNGIRAFLNDSIEVGPANWTPKLIDEFKRRRGYDPVPWLPALTGVVVDDMVRSDAFLYDFRRTLADLIAENHYGVIARAVRERNLRSYAEALEFGRPSLGDDMAMRSHADVPMAALWTWNEDEDVRPVYRADIRGAASVAHIYGQNFVATEALTSAWAPWAFAPKHLRPMIDLGFALGMNLPVIHTSVHQPVTEKAPGLSLAIFGQHFNRLDTWAEQAGPWVKYLSRTSYLLQQGRNVAGVLYAYGEEAPLTALYNKGMPQDVPVSHDWDFANADVILNRISVRDNRIVTSSGQSYALLWLGGQSSRMTVPVLKKLNELADAGARIGGIRPERSPSLADDPVEVERLAARLWSSGAIVAGATAEEAMSNLSQSPDFLAEGSDHILFKHRRTDDAEIYFLTNRSRINQNFIARFGTSGRIPERWDAVTGKVSAMTWRQDGGTTLAPIELLPGQSTFIVFRTGSKETGRTAPDARQRTIAEFTDGWQLQLGNQAPFETSVGSWTQVEAGRYFSGTGSYFRTISIPAKQSGERLWLDLGEVGDLAEVRIDGRVVGTVWCAPWQIELPADLAPGKHRLEIRVTNRWVNRLIGDAQPDTVRVSFTTVPTYRPDAPVQPSGLLGAVRLLAKSAQPTNAQGR
ncbi:glycosyl hydrolase [uncultured Sphingorhabdus sp.]|uniref:glycosyl hydrolase n=1 Tax=uncultured Sphingorhabdus sp. TaxID=1686106 RepID=UPI0026189D25|nr:glycosyl hydrolase [uncultured Sphingorhabdus sp.]HMS20793.1 glycosyl hydrolase [Sphingorhabdus sp.]